MVSVGASIPLKAISEMKEKFFAKNFISCLEGPVKIWKQSRDESMFPKWSPVHKL